ncbi:MAG: FapA family protein [Phycisphaerae bacterium]
MVGTAGTVNINVQVSPDQVKAFLVLRSDHNYSGLTEYDFFLVLTQTRIKITPSTKQRVAKLMAMIRDGVIPPEPFLISEGYPPVESSDQEFILDEKYSSTKHPADDEEVINFYEQHKLITAEAGAVIGTIRSRQAGQDGLDVYGNPLKPKAKSVMVRLGENVALDPDGTTVRATVDGQVIFHNNKISVRTVLEVNGDIDFQTGNIDSATNVVIHGSVRDLFIVRGKRNIYVKGMVEAAYLFADGDITLVGGVKGREKALLEANGNIHAKFLNFAYLHAGGDVQIAKEAINGAIICNGWIDLSRGCLIGGHAFGLKGADIKSIGSPTGVKTVVGVGFNPLIYRQILQIDADIKKDKALVQKIRTSVEPLMQYLKRLTNAQREKATELLFHAETVENHIRKKEEEKKKLLASFPPTDEVELRVTTRIFPNTLILIGDRFSLIQEEIKGPVKLQLKQVQGVKELVLINQLTASIRSLPCGHLDLDVLDIPLRPEIAQPGVKSKDHVQNN